MANSVEQLLKTPIWQMTGEDFIHLLRYALDAQAGTKKAVDRILIAGARPLAEHLSCSESMVHKLLRDGALAPAIVSHIGKKWVFDGEKARACANSFMEQQRMQRNDK